MIIDWTMHYVPIVLVCHSSGGVIAKEALCVANNQFPRYMTIINAIAAMIFFSTPHRYEDKIMGLSRCRGLLEATSGKNTKSSNASAEQEVAILLDLADRFQAISFRTPILSVHELRGTRINTNPLCPKFQLVSPEISFLV
nr:hypothetical protein CFP56_11603 [Quercus suber]